MSEIKAKNRCVLVCGGRDYASKERLFDGLDMIHKKLGVIDEIISGDAKIWNQTKKIWEGADYFAIEWAKERGVDYTVYIAKWKTYGRAAGPIRNREMLEKGKPGLVVAFPGGRGTANMCKLADKAGLLVLKLY